jgi:PTS system nitrogen regulatory IIA component
MEKDDYENLAKLIEKGGVYYDIPGNSPGGVLSALIGSLKNPPLISSFSMEELLRACLEREALVSTGIGNGIALPHPRNPLAADRGSQFTALGFPKHPINWNAPDGKAVDTLFFIVSASAALHLHTLSRINFFCQDGAFLRLLKDRSSQEAIIKYITETEQDWKQENKA